MPALDASAVLWTTLFVAFLGFIIPIINYAAKNALLDISEPQLQQDIRITAHAVITGHCTIPIISEKEPASTKLSALFDKILMRLKKSRAKRILKKSFSNGGSAKNFVNPEQYTVTGIIRADNVLEIWLMTPNWNTVTITSQNRRSYMVHDDKGHSYAAVPARRLAETVGFVASMN